jgi:hypothetical protein
MDDAALNLLLAQLGNPSDGGAYTPTTGELSEGMECEFFGELDCPQMVASPPPVARPSPLPNRGSVAIGPKREVSRLSIAQCRSGSRWLTVLSGKPITWQWWVTDARFEALQGSLRFSAKVRYRVGTRWRAKEGSVDATASFDRESNTLTFTVQRFKVPVYYEFQDEEQRITEVDVAKLYTFSIAVHPHKFVLPPRPGRQALPINARVLSMTPRYEPGRILLDVDLAF